MLTRVCGRWWVLMFAGWRRSHWGFARWCGPASRCWPWCSCSPRLRIIDGICQHHAGISRRGRRHRVVDDGRAGAAGARGRHHRHLPGRA